MIVFEDVRFSYGRDVPVLDGTSIEIPAGLSLLVGPNGCGKSTLLKLAAGVEKPESGRVLVAGADLWKEEVRARGALAYVPEQPDVTPYASLREVLRLVCALRRAPREEADRALERAGLGGLGGRSIRHLSMGQRRRALFAAATIGTPRVLLLDEPLENMDRAMRERILTWIEDVRARSSAVLVATHEVEAFAGSADRAVTVRRGAATLHDLPPEREARAAFIAFLAASTAAT